MTPLIEQLRAAPLWVWPLAGGLSFVVSLAAVTWFVVRLPADYFVNATTADRSLAQRVARNVGGIVLVLLGLLMSVPGVPGQGLLTVLVGLVLIDLPAKRKWELALLRRKQIIAAVNRLRAKWDRPPLILPIQPGVASAADKEPP